MTKRRSASPNGSSPPPLTTVEPPSMSKPPTDAELAAALRRSAKALVDAIPEKVEAAQVHQLASAMKTAVELIKVLEAHDTTEEQTTPEQVIRWEFIYNGAVHDAPPWTGSGDGVSEPVPGGGVRAAVGQDGVGQSGAA